MDRLQRVLDLCLTESECHLQWTKQKCYAKKSGTKLVNKLKSFAPRQSAVSLRTRFQAYISNLVKILDKLLHHMSKLYSSPTDPPSMDLSSFLIETALPSLKPAHWESLRADIKDREVRQVIKDLKPHKWPGPDRFMALFYKKLSDVAVPHLTSLLNALSMVKTYPKQCYGLLSWCTPSRIKTPKPWPTSVLSHSLTLI